MTDRPRGHRAAGDVAEHADARPRPSWRGRFCATLHAATHRSTADQPHVMTVGELASARGLTAVGAPPDPPAEPCGVDLVKRPAAPCRPAPEPAAEEPVTTSGLRASGHAPADPSGAGLAAGPSVPVEEPDGRPAGAQAAVERSVAAGGPASAALWAGSAPADDRSAFGRATAAAGHPADRESAPLTSAAVDRARPAEDQPVAGSGGPESGPLPAEPVPAEPVAAARRASTRPQPDRPASAPITAAPARETGPRPSAPVNRTLPADRLSRGPAAFRRPGGPPAPYRPPNRFSVPARPPVVEEQAILGLTRRSRGRVGSRVFALFFVFVYAVIALQLIAVLFGPSP